MHRYDEDLALRRLGDNRFAAELRPGWRVGRAPNGGFLAALGAASLAETLAHPDPLSVTTYFLRRLDMGPVEIVAEVIRAGRTQSSGQVSITQDGQEAVRMLGIHGDLAAATGPSRVLAEPPQLPPPEAWPSSSDLAEQLLPEVISQFDIRLDPGAITWFGGSASEARIEAWIRFADGREPDAGSLLLFVDALPPPILNLVPGGWVPTIELTTHVRGHPAPGWLRIVSRTTALIDGYLEEDAMVWDSADRLVAMSRQLALLQPPR